MGFAGDGKGVVFAKRTDSKETVPNPEVIEIYSLSLGTGQSQRLHTLRNAYFLNIHLSNRSDIIAFVSRVGDRTSLLVIPSTNGNQRELISINDPKVLISTLAISPDGSFIVFGKQTRTSLLSMLTD